MRLRPGTADPVTGLKRLCPDIATVNIDLMSICAGPLPLPARVPPPLRGRWGAAPGWALVHCRGDARPEDVRAGGPAVAGRRLQPREGGEVSAMTQALLQPVPVVRH